MFTFLQAVFAFIIILVPLVVFHEFGHFIFAKIFGVKAEVFSIGFGPKLWKRQIGETELCVSAIPMGGYVKLLGEDREAEIPPEEQNRALHRQKAWKRFFIFFGGPLFNFILAIFIFMLILAIGEPQLSSVVGRVVHNSYAEKVGFRSGDRILEINQTPVKRFEDVYTMISDHPGKDLSFTILRPGTTVPVHISAKTSEEEGYSAYGESTLVGEIDGLYPIPRGNQAGVSYGSSAAALAGIHTGDRIVSFNSHPISNWEQFNQEYEVLSHGHAFTLGYESGDAAGNEGGDKAKPVIVHWSKPKDAKGLGVDFGLFSSELFVSKATPKSPAEGAGIQTGDRLVAVDHQPVYSFFQLKEKIQKAGEKEGKLNLEWERNGKMMSAELEPMHNESRDPILKKTIQYTVGVMPMLTFAEPDTVVERILNPFTLLYKGTEKMVKVSWANLVMLKKMAGGKVSMGTIGGPLMIGKIAGESMSRGLIIFLTNMAIFSVGLGVLNVLPIPVLDGGHLLLLGVEVIRGKPLTLKQMEIAQGFGLVFILLLMGIAFHNDISRLIYS